jgi:hypothetical protein
MPKQSLEKLIGSLTQGELRAFSLSIKGDNNPSYYKLFNEIRSGKSNSKTKKSNNETQLRKYLYNTILESLVKRSKTIDSQIAQGLKHAEVLYDRQLLPEAWKEVLKIEKLATLHERFGYIIQILEWKKIIGFRRNTFTTNDYNETSIQENETIDQYINYLQAADTYYQLKFSKKKQGYTHEMEKLPDLSHIKSISVSDCEDLPKRTLYYHRMSEALHYCQLQDIQAQYEVTKLIVRDAEVIIETSECMQAYFEHLTSCICIGKFDELLHTFVKLKGDVKKGKFGNSLDIKLKLFYYASNYELMAYTYMGNSLELKQKIKEVEMGLIKFETSLTIQMKMLICSALKMAYYFLNQPEQSKIHINKIINYSVHNLRLDLYQDALLFDFLIALDENNIDKMEQTILTIQNDCKLSKPQYKFEKNLLQLFVDFSLDNLNKVELYQGVLNAYQNNIPTFGNGIHYTENQYPFYLWAKSNLQKAHVLKLAETLYSNNFKH